MIALTVPLLVGFNGLLRQNIQVRLEGYLDGTREQVHPWEMLEVRVGEAAVRSFAMTNIISLSPSVMGADILQAVEPLHPNFILTGDPKLTDQIAAAKPNQLLKITGYTSFGPQWILVTLVEVGEPVTGPTPTPSLRKELLGF